MWDWTVGWESWPESPIFDINPDGNMTTYPHLKTLPFGLFFAGSNRSACTFPNSESVLWPWDNPAQYLMEPRSLYCQREGGACVIMTLVPGDTVRVMNVRGSPEAPEDEDGSNPRATAEVIGYYRDGAGAIQHTGWRSAEGNFDPSGELETQHARRRMDAVMLPDGAVLAVGGEFYHKDEQDPMETWPHRNNLDCEIYTPAPDLDDARWRFVAPLQQGRKYHSVALLLPDGRVWVAGDEAEGTGEGDPNFDGTYEIYYPPYLFNAAGDDWAVRPEITDAPTTVPHGLSFEIDVAAIAPLGDAGDIDEVCLVRPGSVTHSNNFTQRRIRLSHTTIPGGSEPDRLIVSGPKDETYAPEGYYLLFILDDGVPSVAKTVKVERGSYVTEVGTLVRWGADVWLDQDFEVVANSALQILPGTVVHVEAGKTSTSLPFGSSLIDIGVAVGGGMTAEGATFTSAGAGAAAAGDWGGFVLAASGGVSSSGYYASTQCWIKDSTIEGAEKGIRIRSLIAPGIENVTFPSGANTADIFVDLTDTVIPRYRFDGIDFVEDPTVWDLVAPTKVVATQGITPVGDALFGTSGKTNVIAQGPLITREDPMMPGALVTFSSDVVTPPQSSAAGNDWGGIFLDSLATGSRLEHVDIGYASNPLFILRPHDVEVRHATIHDFASTGLWVYETRGTEGPGLIVEATVIDRNETLHESLGNVGIFLDKSTNVQLGSPGLENLVLLQGANDVSGGVGIWVAREKMGCSDPSPVETLRIGNTTIVGPGDVDGNWSGIHFNWVCGTADRTVEILENWIEEFNFAGLELDQVVDAQVNCNRVVNSRRGVAFRRDSGTEGSPLRFRENSFEQNQDGDHAAVATDVSLKIELGPEVGGNRGRNVLKVWEDATSFVENDESTSDVLDARHNYWYLQGASGERFLSEFYADEHDEVDKRCRTSSGGDYSADATVNTSNYKRTHAHEPECPPRHPGAPSGSRLAGPPSTAGKAFTAELPVLVDGSVPAATRLGKPFPNPTSGGITVPFALAVPQAGKVNLEIFDVRGRLVRRVTNTALEAARYQATWSGLDGSGKRVTPGTYFVRFVARDHVQTAKVTVLR